MNNTFNKHPENIKCVDKKISNATSFFSIFIYFFVDRYTLTVATNLLIYTEYNGKSSKFSSPVELSIWCKKNNRL